MGKVVLSITIKPQPGGGGVKPPHQNVTLNSITPGGEGGAGSWLMNVSELGGKTSTDHIPGETL